MRSKSLSLTRLVEAGMTDDRYLGEMEVIVVNVLAEFRNGLDDVSQSAVARHVRRTFMIQLLETHHS